MQEVEIKIIETAIEVVPAEGALEGMKFTQPLSDEAISLRLILVPV